MRQLGYILILAATAILPLKGQVNLQRGLTREQIEAAVHPTVASDGSRILHFEFTSCDLGKLSEADAPVSQAFSFRNVSGKNLRIEHIRTNCGCTVARYDTTAIAPNATSWIILTYNPKNHPGTIDTDAFVYVRGCDKQPVARLSLYGEVIDGDEWRHLPYTMGTLRVKRKEASLSELPSHGKPSVRIPCANSGSEPLHLSSRLLPPYASFRTDPEVIAPGEEADIVITVDASKIPLKEGRAQFSVLVEGVNGRPSDRTLNITVQK